MKKYALLLALLSVMSSQAKLGVKYSIITDTYGPVKETYLIGKDAANRKDGKYFILDNMADFRYYQDRLGKLYDIVNTKLGNVNKEISAFDAALADEDEIQRVINQYDKERVDKSKTKEERRQAKIGYLLMQRVLKRRKDLRKKIDKIQSMTTKTIDEATKWY